MKGKAAIEVSVTNRLARIRASKVSVKMYFFNIIATLALAGSVIAAPYVDPSLH